MTVLCSCFTCALFPSQPLSRATISTAVGVCVYWCVLYLEASGRCHWSNMLMFQVTQLLWSSAYMGFSMKLLFYYSVLSQSDKWKRFLDFVVLVSSTQMHFAEFYLGVLNRTTGILLLRVIFSPSKKCTVYLKAGCIELWASPYPHFVSTSCACFSKST